MLSALLLLSLKSAITVTTLDYSKMKSKFTKKLSMLVKLQPIYSSSKTISSPILKLAVTS